METVLMIKTESLETNEAFKILEDANRRNCISAPPKKPKAGQLFLYRAEDASKEGNIILYNI